MPAGGAFEITFVLLWVVFGLAGLAATVIWLWALIDCLQREFRDNTLKLIWALVILLGNFIGAVVYLIIGRPQGTRR